MASCEMCGKEVPRTRTVTVGGTVLDVCNECARFGDEVRKEAPPPEPLAYGADQDTQQQRIAQAQTRGRPKDVLETAGGGQELVEDYPKRIREGRQRMGWKQDELGQRINEKKSVISHLESGETRPDDKLVHKLEAALDIKLKEPAQFQMETGKKRVRTGGVTLGDLIKMQK
jgi:putative transcription factor